jgi:hypothetical protein
MYHYVLGLYLVCTWYVLVCILKNKKMNVHNVWNRTVDLMHSILRALLLRYQRAFHGDTKD